MHLIVGGRQVGKTARIMRELHSDPNAVLLVHNQDERGRLLGEYQWPGIEDQISSVNLVINLRGRRISTVYLDNLDLILPRLLGLAQPIACATFTGTAEFLAPERPPPMPYGQC